MPREAQFGAQLSFAVEPEVKARIDAIERRYRGVTQGQVCRKLINESLERVERYYADTYRTVDEIVTGVDFLAAPEGVDAIEPASA